MTADPGLPLTTGEGNTAQERAERHTRLLTDCEPKGIVSQPHICAFSDALSISTRDVLALLAECGRLRAFSKRANDNCVSLSEQLDAARQALERGENDWCFMHNLHNDVTLAPEVRRALAVANLKLIRAAHAALGVVGGRPEGLVSAASGAPDGDTKPWPR